MDTSYQVLFTFFLGIIQAVAKFATWLTTPLDYINMPPLAIFSIVGVSVLLGIHLVRLFVGG